MRRGGGTFKALLFKYKTMKQNNPLEKVTEKIPPSSAHEAFEDLFRDLDRGDREKTKRLIESLDPSRIVLIAEGEIVEPMPTGLELHLVNKILYCVRHELLKTPLEAVGVLKSVKQEVKDGGVFI